MKNDLVGRNRKVKDLDRYLLTMFDRQPRRFRVIENIVRNKRTQANLFWALNYQILNWLGSDPALTRSHFDKWLTKQQVAGYLLVDEKTAKLTARGQELKTAVQRHSYQPHNSQWAWLINPSRYAERFLLAIQAVSELAHQHRHYVPLNISVTEMAVVKDWLSQPQLIPVVHEELLQIGHRLATQDPRLAEFFAHRLLGFETTGWTVLQAQRELKLSAEEVHVLNRDVWLGIAGQLQANPQSNLGRLMNGLNARAPISNSAWRTLQEFQGGQSVEMIARNRHLKLSTVREHLLEAAIIIPTALQWPRLLSVEQGLQLHQQYSGPAATWRFQAVGDDPAADFFKFRLCQIKEFHQNNG